MGPSAPRAITRLPALPGVYRLGAGDGAVLYIGRAAQLRSRVASYWSDLRDREHLRPMVRQVTQIEALVCDSVHEAAWLERNLLEASLPPWNRTKGGQESVVYIRMDLRPPKPGLSVEYVIRDADEVRHFGPYLGGLRARQAVTGLGRILPLSYTSDRLDGARLDMARARDYLRADQAGIVEAIDAILRRDPVAVSWARAELEELRGRAAQALAFELAGRINDEIDALAWVTSPQKVSTTDGGDFEVFGWSGGVLINLAIRDGRLTEWSQTQCGRPDAATRLAATPPAWAEFAQRNAELAAALT
jgi:excinuclease ABC subunit C